MTLTNLVLPDWFRDFRPHQTSALEEILEAFQYSDVVVLDAPTGSGKTLLAEAVRQRMGLPGLYTCHSKSLQDQFQKDYPYGFVLKGRRNYPTELYPDRYGSHWDSLSCEDCTKSYSGGDCSWCSTPLQCPYEVAKVSAVDSELAVVNTSYLLAEANYVGELSRRNQRTPQGQLVIADECDLLDEAVTGFVSLVISPRTLKDLKIGPPRRMTVEASWLEWVEGVEPIVRAKAQEARVKARGNPNKRTVLRANHLSSLSRKIGDLRKGLEGGGWVYTGDKERVEFKPVWSDQVAQGVLWKHGKKWLLMSATVISAGQLLSELGWHSGTSTTVLVSSTFPAANRPIYIRPVANMTSKEKEDEWPKLVPEIQRILDKHPGDRVLVHTHSYELARYLHERLRYAQPTPRNLGTYTCASERDQALRDYLAVEGSVLFAPSLDRGVDLPGDACRVQVVAKVPFGYLGDRQINARLHSKHGQNWYTVDAIRTLVQMCGRGVRSETDTCATYILDKQFQARLWGFNRNLFPQWWREALVWREG